jgi:hypothetical protein
MAMIPSVRSPSRDDREELESTLRLRAEGAVILWREVDQIVEQIKEHQRISQQRGQGRERARINTYLRTLSKQLGNLDNHLADLDPSTTQVIRRLLGGRLAELLSHRGFAELLNEPMSYDVSSHVLESREATARAGPARAIESELESYRANVSTRFAPDILKRLLRALRQPVLHFLEIERANRGGARPKIYRNHVIARLAPVYERLWHKAPVSTPEGKFVLLCELVLGAIGLDTAGADTAVARILKNSKSESS